MDPDVMARPEPTTLDRLFAAHRLVLYDGVCPLCAGFAGFVLTRDRGGHFRFVAIQSALGQAILRRFGLPPTDWESYVLVERGRPYVKSDAFFRIVGALPAPWSWLRAGGRLPPAPADWLYDRIARNRYLLFGRLDRCAVPPAGIRERVLS